MALKKRTEEDAAIAKEHFLHTVRELAEVLAEDEEEQIESFSIKRARTELN